MLATQGEDTNCRTATRSPSEAKFATPSKEGPSKEVRHTRIIGD